MLIEIEDYKHQGQHHSSLQEVQNRTNWRSSRNDFAGWTKALSLPLAHPAQAY